jgi:hypothetical protein
MKALTIPLPCYFWQSCGLLHEELLSDKFEVLRHKTSLSPVYRQLFRQIFSRSQGLIIFEFIYVSSSAFLRGAINIRGAN